MSLESSIAALTQQAGLLMDLPQQVNAAALAQINAIGAAYQSRIAGMTPTFYVNQVTGADANAGTLASPFRSLQKAIDQTPFGGRVHIILQADHTIAGAPIFSYGRHVHISSDSGVKHNLYFERHIDASTTPAYRGVRGFLLAAGGSLSLRGVTINVPLLDDNYTTYAPFNMGLFAAVGTEWWQALHVTMYLCDYKIPAAPYCSMFPSESLVVLRAYGLTLNGATTSLSGQVSAAQTNTAGVATTTLPWILSNLTTI